MSPKGIAATMTVDTLAVEPQTEANDTPEGVLVSSPAVPEVEAKTGAEEPAVEDAAVESSAAKPKKAPAKKAAAKKTKTLELTLTVTGTADGEWHAELKQGSTYLARNLAVAAAAVSRAAKELHEDISTPIDEVIEAAREQQAAKVAALEAELEAARKALAELAD
ncbi:hypothetical protein EV643_111155 [Kribbella sp. VKM Ac-2527]|uniref:Mucin n=2 Tax=Kribbella caucasensis TaxID=2512215 RepID=A0A4R6K927_9ACTN|nr:hypothetical protein EV643_111155 [Kribbella sp. VKM Ac-2527]